MDNFISLDFLNSFAGMLFAIIILTQVFKRLLDFAIPNNQTKWLVLLFTIVMCARGAYILGDLTTGASTMNTIFLWTVNACILWTSAMKTFDIATRKDKVDGVLNIKSNEIGEEKWDFDVHTDLVKIPTQKYMRLKVEPQPVKK